MAISLRTAGSWVASNATTQTVTLPTHQTGDMLIVRVGMKHATLPGNITCDTSGWARIGQHNNGTTASSNSAGDVQVAAFWKEATSGSETSPVITFHASTAATPGCAVAMAYQKGGTEVWATPLGAGGSISAATSYTSTMGSHIAAKSGDMLDSFAVTNDNTTLTVPTVSQTGLTLNTVTESPATALSDATSNDISADGCYRLATAGTSSAAAVASGTNSVADVGAAFVTRLRAAVPTNTAVAEVSLASASTPAARVSHSIGIRGRVTSGAGKLRVALYEGSTDRSGTLETPALSTSLTTYVLPISDASAANISSYSNLGIRFWGYANEAGSIVFEVDQVWLEAPAGSAPQQDVTGEFINNSYSIYAPIVAPPLLLDFINNSYQIFAPTLTQQPVVTGAFINNSYTIFAPQVNQSVSLGFINNSYTINAPSVAQPVVGAFINNSYTINAPTVSLNVAAAFINNSYSINAPSVSLNVVLPTITNSYTINAPTVTPITSITGAFIDNSYSIFAPTVVASQVVTGEFINNSYSIFAPTLRMSVVMPFINNGYTINAPAVSLNVALPTISNSYAIFAPTITPGQVTVAPPFINNSYTIFAPSVRLSVVLGFINNGNTVYTPSVRMTVALSFINNSYQIFAPQTRLSVELSKIDNGYSINNPTVINRQIITNNFINNSYVINEPVINAGGTGVGLGFINNSYIISAPTIIPGAVTVTLQFINNLPTVFSPSITPGQVTVQLSFINNGYTIYTPAIRLGVDVPFLNNSYVIYAPNLTVQVSLSFINNSYNIFAPSFFVFGQTQDLSGVLAVAHMAPEPRTNVYLSPEPQSRVRLG